MDENKDVIDVSKENFKDELITLSVICDKLNSIYMRCEHPEENNSDTEEIKEELSEKGRVLK